MTSLWWIALTICVPLGQDSRDCTRVVIHPADLGEVWTERRECERVLPAAVAVVMIQLENAGWGSAWVEGEQCERQGAVM